MGIPFVKMHGLGNDFVVVDERRGDRRGWKRLAPRIAHRRLGVGCDQVLVLRPSERADVAVAFYNADGSPAGMCGNGLRCVARYLAEREGAGPSLRVETPSGVVAVRVADDGAEVDLGPPRFEGHEIPARADRPVREHPLPLGETSVKVTCVSVGNPHAVVFVDDADAYPVEEVGPRIERHPFFPERTNVEFVQVLAPNRIRMRVWERGAGLTPACGSGAAAAAVAANWTGRCGRDVTVVLDGGELAVRWDPGTRHVFLAGPAAFVFEGTWLGER